MAYGDAKWSVMMTSRRNEQNSSPARLPTRSSRRWRPSCTCASPTATATGSTLRPKTDDVDNLLFAYETLAVDEDGMESKRVVREEPLFMRPARIWVDALGPSEFARRRGTRACAAGILRARDINPYLLPSFPTTPSRWRSPRALLCSSTSAAAPRGAERDAAARRGAGPFRRWSASRAPSCWRHSAWARSHSAPNCSRSPAKMGETRGPSRLISDCSFTVKR